MSSILLTGANGFIGAALCRHLAARGHRVRGSLRKDRPLPVANMERCDIGALEDLPDWRPHLENQEVVVHCAARVHVIKETASDPLAAFRAANVEGSRHLAAQAIEMGVRRLIFISTIGATLAGQAGDRASPYQQSKLEAETALLADSRGSALELVILRPPLVYGSGAPGNFARLVRAIKAGWPLPLASIKNQRSFLFIGNLTEAVESCLSHPQAPGTPLGLSDGAALSSPGFVRLLAEAMDRPARLVPCPAPILTHGLGLVGRRRLADSLCESLVSDDGPITARLGWQPRYSTQQGLALSVNGG